MKYQDARYEVTISLNDQNQWEVKVLCKGDQAPTIYKYWTYELAAIKGNIIVLEEYFPMTPPHGIHPKRSAA